MTTKTFRIAPTERKLEKSACWEGRKRNLFNQRDELFYDSLLCCVCLLSALFSPAYLINILCWSAQKQQKASSSFPALHKSRLYAAIIGFSPTKANTTFFLSFHLHTNFFRSPLALFQLTHLSEGKRSGTEANTRTLRSTLWFHQTHFNFPRNDES